jgi:hypothetical protein
MVLVGPDLGAWTALLRGAVGFEQVATEDDRLVDRTPRAGHGLLESPRIGEVVGPLPQLFGICLELLQ